MNTSTNKKVICVKDIPSNLIEEAIFILKSDAVKSDNTKTNLIRKEIILKETEDFVKEYSDEFDRIEIEENEDSKYSINNLKIKLVLVGVLIASVCCLISMIV